MALSTESSTISPRGILYRSWKILMAILAGISLWISPYYMSFLKTSSRLSLIDNIFNGIFALDIFLGFFVAYKDRETNLMVTQKTEIALNYALRKYLLLDLLSVLPVNILYMVLQTDMVYIMCLVFRFWRLKKLMVCLSNIEENTSCFFLAGCLKLIYLILLNVHLGGCAFYLIASLHPDANMSWTKTMPDFFKWKLRKRYVTSLYLAMTTFTTVGYGDLHAESPGEMIFSMVYMMWNMGFGAYVLLQLNSMLERSRDECREEDEVSGTCKRENAAKDSHVSDYVRAHRFRLQTGAGIRNIHNSCFMSVILQAFVHTEPLYRGLRDCGHPFTCADEVFCILCALRRHFKKALDDSREIVDPGELFGNLEYFSPTFVKGRHEDAHEFLQRALEKLQNCGTVGETLIDQIFQGHLVSEIQGCTCGHSNKEVEPFTTLSLGIENMSNIQQALDHYFKVEEMDSKCNSCEKEGTLVKQLRLKQAPSVAAIHLKRFDKDDKKVCTTVGFSMDLDLQPYISGTGSENVPSNYDLYAIVEHIGSSPESGHYVCYVRSAPDKWHLINDTKVTSVSAEYVLQKEAYILFYARKGTPWFSSMVKNQSYGTESV